MCHNFVIADKITAEVILGIDFLEENNVCWTYTKENYQ